MTQAIILPSSGGGGGQPYATGMGLLGMSLADVSDAQVAYTLTSGLFVMVLVPLVAGTTVAKVGAILDTAGVTASGNNEMALYSISGNTATQQAITGDMSATFAGALGYITGTLGTPFPVPTTGLYGVSALTHFSGTAPKIVGSATATSGQAFAPIHGFRTSIFVAAQASSPASLNVTTATINSAEYFLTAE